MRHLPARTHYFYEDDGVESVTTQSEGKRRFGPSPWPFAVPSSAQPHGLGVSFVEHTVLTEPTELTEPSRSDGSGCSSASIERVIHCNGNTLSHGLPSDSTHGPFIGDECVSLRQLQESVKEALCDVRRMDVLMCKAVWHALAQRRSSHGAKRHTRAATASAQKVSPRTRHCASTSAEVHHGAIGLSESTGLMHDKPFLPPDRYPTTPALQDVPDHFARNLSGALFAAHRAGLLEKQRARLHRRLPSNIAESEAVATIPLSSSASARRTALQSVSRLASSAAAASRSDRTAVSSGGRRVGAPTADPVDGEEECVLSSVSLIILRVAKVRAIATVFLRQVRLEVYRRRALRASVDLRYSYYVQRRLLRLWNTAATIQRCRRISLLRSVVLHWQRFARRRKELHGVLSTWRRVLQERSRAFGACQQAQRQRCFQHWLRVFTWHRECSALCEAASQFAVSHQRRHRGQTWHVAYGDDAEVMALLQGRSHASGSPTVVATAVGSRLLMRRLFLGWRRRTEWRLMAHLAAWHHAQHMRANVARQVCSCARRVALQHHRSRPEHQRHRCASAAENTYVGGTFSEAQSRAPLRVYIVAVKLRGLLKYKTSSARCIASTAELRRCFDRWHACFQARRADRFHLQCVYAYAVCRWLRALAAHRACRQRKQLIFSRWVAAMKRCRTAAVASKLYVHHLAHHTLWLWRNCLSVRRMCRALLLQDCFDHWRDRKLLQSASRALRCARQRHLLRRWHRCAQTRVQARTNLYVAETISETALVLGCFRRWRFRAAERHRGHLAWGVLMQLRRERMSRRYFDVWRRRVFGPTLPWARRLNKDHPSSVGPLTVGHRS
ncbi:hypothetical protein CUR178_01151 [Leishmania enriettii]|uniref:Sfi1 spindle body domain-containing protein n=1 Tax=Leishmania enriettii TaxID=5663 RepID=A0A836GH37_LEIEN|nr:hypothetical protein CUR178_01151 [Leishmania enriettii]